MAPIVPSSDRWGNLSGRKMCKSRRDLAKTTANGIKMPCKASRQD
jgi:hypothetical protein